ncbi:hypothetical protein [Pseudomonas aegrilactucae]|uniref:Uncharacterized protein n=1 Tax=Pseudomonas aegrilactucae TaxID=2854028 RepID=A0A9Q2XIC1_9PSED|nr:hypothetical protein [Pseudomonas aegrilactucae]MBV6286679.1 hypothetical protein [Pseudomonas aegrilactucae]
MSSPSWEQLCALFEHPRSARVRTAHAELLASYPSELSGYGVDDDYLSVFQAVFQLLVEGREGIFSLLESLVERLGPDILQVEFDDDYETAIVRFDGREVVFHCPGLHYETFSTDMQTLQDLMAGRYVFRVFYDGGVGDAWPLLMVPASLWLKAEQRYGDARLSSCLIAFGSEVALDQPFDPERRWRAPRRRFDLSRLRIPLALTFFIAVVAVLVNGYIDLSVAKAPSVPACERMGNAFAQLPAAQAQAMAEDMRRRGLCE